jgi:hypothetical protein
LRTCTRRASLRMPATFSPEVRLRQGMGASECSFSLPLTRATNHAGQIKNEATGLCIDHGFRAKPGEKAKLVDCNGKVTQK